MNVKLYLYKVMHKIWAKSEWHYYWACSTEEAIRELKRNGASFKDCTFYGKCHIRKSANGIISIGDHFVCQSGSLSCIDTCIDSKLQTDGYGKLIIGNNVGISSTVIHAWDSIVIEDNVKIGAGCMIFDTNFHSLDASIRNSPDDCKHVKTAPVHIKKNAFIGTRSIITKGVTIGENSIVAAGSVVVKDIPDNQIWGGNPARFIKELI